MRARARAAAALPLVAWLFAASPASAGESFHYRWSLRGFLGTLASLFVPGQGEGLLTVEQLPGGRERSELRVTSTESDAGEYFVYGSEWDPAGRRTLRAWSDLVWRGEKKAKQAELADDNVLDIVAAIQLLRRERPEYALRLEIWSDGRLYPVVVLPRERERRRLAGREVEARHFSVHGVSLPGRRLWKGELDLWIAGDVVATPVEIVVARRGARVRLQLVETPTLAPAAPSEEPPP
ncbi:MAG TPA: DUF3108 domain-containing protein [Thermoanaerobaculia bacterium]|jgi:hypothetical protein